MSRVTMREGLSIEDFGYNFNGKFKSHEAKDYCRERGWVPQFNGNKPPNKTDFVMTIERYYAKERCKQGKQPFDYLELGFRSTNYTIAQNQQGFALHGIRYSDTPTLAKFQVMYDEHIESMRAEVYGNNRRTGMEGGMDGMNINRGAASEGSSRSAAPNAASGSDFSNRPRHSRFEGVAPQPKIPMSSAPKGSTPKAAAASGGSASTHSAWGAVLQPDTSKRAIPHVHPGFGTVGFAPNSSVWGTPSPSGGTPGTPNSRAFSHFASSPSGFATAVREPAGVNQDVPMQDSMNIFSAASRSNAGQVNVASPSRDAMRGGGEAGMGASAHIQSEPQRAEARKSPEHCELCYAFAPMQASWVNAKRQVDDEDCEEAARTLLALGTTLNDLFHTEDTVPELSIGDITDDVIRIVRRAVDQTQYAMTQANAHYDKTKLSLPSLFCRSSLVTSSTAYANLRDECWSGSRTWSCKVAGLRGWKHLVSYEMLICGNARRL